MLCFHIHVDPIWYSSYWHEGVLPPRLHLGLLACLTGSGITHALSSRLGMRRSGALTQEEAAIIWLCAQEPTLAIAVQQALYIYNNSRLPVLLSRFRLPLYASEYTMLQSYFASYCYISAQPSTITAAPYSTANKLHIYANQRCLLPLCSTSCRATYSHYLQLWSAQLSPVMPSSEAL